MITEVERKQLLQDVQALVNCVPASEQWRVKLIEAAVANTLRYVSALETSSKASAKAGVRLYRWGD